MLVGIELEVHGELVDAEIGAIPNNHRRAELVMSIQPRPKLRAVKGVERIFGNDGEEIREWQGSQLGNGLRLARIDLAMRRKIGKFNRIRRMAVLRQQKISHSDRVSPLESSDHRWNDALHPRAGKCPLVTEAVDHIDTEQRHAPLLRFGSKIIPRDRGQLAFPLDERPKKVGGLLHKVGW